MKDLRQRILRRFYRDDHRLSRNRNFDTYLDPAIRHAARAGRLLRSIRSDILNRDLSSISLERTRDDTAPERIAVEVCWEGGRRVSYLSAEELALLREDFEVDSRLTEGPEDPGNGSAV